jgi:hypothetical protein
MTPHDTDIRFALDTLIPRRDDHGDWNRILREAQQSRRGLTRVRSNKRLALVLAAAILAGSLAAVSALGVANDWWFARPSSQVKVDTITTSGGSSWTLKAAVSEREGACVSLVADDGGKSAQGCDVSVRGANDPAETRLHALSYVVTGTQFGPAFVFGAAAADVASVEVALADGEIITTKTVPAPSRLAGLRFYAVEIPAAASPVALVARDTAGAASESRPLRGCDRPFLLLRSEGICTYVPA